MDKFVVRTSASGATLPPKRPRLFVDLDGVLADFDSKVLELTGKRPGDFERSGPMWAAISPPRTQGFYASLPWMSDGMVLWEFVQQYQPTILTGLPMGTWAEAQKRDWCARMLGPSVPVICCMARDKHKHCQAGDILIDDREEKARKPWEEAGGKFIHHTSASKSIEALRRALPPPSG